MATLAEQTYRVGSEDLSWSQLGFLFYGDPGLGWLLYRYQVVNHQWQLPAHVLHVAVSLQIPVWSAQALTHKVTETAQQVYIPTQSYPVTLSMRRPAETMDELARRYYGLTEFAIDIQRANRLSTPALQLDQTIIIPAIVDPSKAALAERMRRNRGIDF